MNLTISAMERGLSWWRVSEEYEAALEASKTQAEKAAEAAQKAEAERRYEEEKKRAEEERARRMEESIAQKAVNDAKELAKRLANKTVTGSCAWVRLQQEALTLQSQGLSDSALLTGLTPGRQRITVKEALPGCLAAKKGTCIWCCPETARAAAQQKRGGYRR